MTQVDNLVTQLRQYETSSSVQPVKCQVELLISALQQLQTGTTGGPFLPLAGTSILTGTQGPIQLADGTAANPSIYFENQNGFYYDPVNLGIGFSIGGIQSGYIDSVGSYNFVAGGGLCENVIYGEGGVRQGAIRFSNDNGGASFQCGKGRGSIAVPLVPALGDALGNFDFSGFNGTTATNVTNGARIRGVLTETGTVSATAMGTQMQFFACPIGSATLQTIGTFDTLNGLQLVAPSSSGPSIVLGQANINGLTTTAPGWTAKLLGDAFPRAGVGLSATDTGIISVGPGTAALGNAYGLFYDATNVGLGFNNNNVEVAVTTTSGLKISIPGGGTASMQVFGEAGTSFTARRFSNDSLQPTYDFVKSRGTIAVPLVIQINDAFGNMQYRGFDGTANRTGANIAAASIQTGTINTTNFGTKLSIQVCPLNSGTLSTVAVLDAQTGLQLTIPLQLAGGQLLSTVTALTNNAAASIGTLTNAPTAGNPTKWIPINDNGTIRNIPAW